MSKRIKVIILHNIMAPYRFGLFREISKDKNIDLTVWFMSQSAKNRKWKIRDKDLRFKYSLLPGISINFQKGDDLINYYFNYSFIFRYLRQMPDVIICAGWLDFACQAAFFLSRILGKKFIIWSESTIYEKSRKRRLTTPFVKFLVRHSDAAIAIGTRSKEYLMGLGMPQEKIFIAYSTVDVGYFMKESKRLAPSKSEIRKDMNIQTKFVILYVGQFIKRKGVIYLLKAYEKIQKKG